MKLLEFRQQLAHELDSRHKLYLDLAYWNHLCDIFLARIESYELQRIFSLLESLVRDGVLVCPIELNTFAELNKQRLPDKIKATAAVIDRFSLGVVLVPPHERAFIEILRLLEAAPSGPPFPSAPKDEVWTKVAFLFGHGELVSDRLSPEMLAELNALLLRELWDMGFTQFLDQLDGTAPVSFEWAKTAADKANVGKADARVKFPSYRALYLSESQGILDLYASVISDVCLDLFDRAGGDISSVTQEQKDRAVQQTQNLLVSLLEKYDLARQLPSVHVQATLFASVQWDVGRRYKPNDFQDFGHAAAALGYCDGFATERSLAALLRQSKLTQHYDTTVLSTPAELLAWLESL